MPAIATFYLAQYLRNNFFLGKKQFCELKNNKTVKLAQFFCIMRKMKLQSRSSARIVAGALTHVAIPHMCGLNGVYICGRDLRVCSLLHASYQGQGRFNFFIFLFFFSFALFL